MPGCEDLAVEQIQGQPGLRIKVQQDQIARYGLPVERVLEVVEAVGSKPLGEVIEGREACAVGGPAARGAMPQCRPNWPT